MRHSATLGVGLLTTGLAAGPVVAQSGTPVDRELLYEQTYRFPRLIRGAELSLTWLEDGESFRYRDVDRRQWRVDPKTATRERVKGARREAWTGHGAANVTLGFAAPPPAGPFVGSAESHGRRALVEGSDLMLVTGDERRRLAEGEDEYGWLLPSAPWSADGRFLLAQRLDVRAVHHLPVVDYSDAIPTTRMVPYAKSGDAIPVTETWVFDVENDERFRIELDPAARPYVMNLGWQAGVERFWLLTLSRDVKVVELLEVDPTEREVEVLHREESETFVGGLELIVGGWRDLCTPLRGGRAFLWRSEETGFAQLALHDRDAAAVVPLTRGSYPVERVEGVDEAGDWVYYSASTAERPYDRHLYRVDLAGKRQMRLTEETGVHRVALAPSFRYFVDSHSALTRPPRIDLRSTEGELLLELQSADLSGLDDLPHVPPEAFVVNAADGETELHGVLYEPFDFDPERAYPVLDVIYAGPWLSVVQHDFVGASAIVSRARALAQLGYVVFMVDARGTPGRSKAFQDANYGRIGQTEIPDHVATLHQLAAERPYMDLDRVGVVGGSWGGYFAIRAMFTAPDVFHVGVSIAPGDLTEAPVINEPNMGLPRDNPEGYRVGSILHGVEDFRGKLLLVHGTSDTNAPISTTMRLVDALIRADKDFDLVILPGQAHGFTGAADQ